MSRTSGWPFAFLIVVPALCLIVPLAPTGCGWQSASTLGSTTGDDENTRSSDDSDPSVEPRDDDGSDHDTTSTDQTPENAYCETVANWDVTWADFENEVLELVNQQRAKGADCGSAGTFGPAEPLIMNAALRCAARNHSMDMGTRDYFDHYTPEEVGPSERLDQSGYSGSSWAENIARGYATPEAVVSGWMNSSGHCSNIMRAQSVETGIGYYEGSLWTQTFGRP
jgi:uncharacterized protein YkwD